MSTAGTTRVVAMTRAHITELMRWEREMFGTEAWTAGSYRAELADVTHRSYSVVESADGALLGWAGVLIVGETAEVMTVGVIPTARRRGLGRELLCVLRDEAVNRGAVELFLEVRVDNDAAIAMYAAEGFAEVGRRRGYYDHGRVDALVLRLDLAGVTPVPPEPLAPADPPAPVPSRDDEARSVDSRPGRTLDHKGGVAR